MIPVLRVLLYQTQSTLHFANLSTDGLRFQLTSQIASKLVYVQISKANSFSKSFKTLRDMTGESFIEQNRLTRVKSLGTGAFAAGQTTSCLSLRPRLVSSEVAVPYACAAWAAWTLLGRCPLL